MSAVPPATASALATPARFRGGWGRTTPGVLVAGDGRLAFLADEGALFDVPVGHVTDVRWSRHRFGGVRLRAAGAPYRITFGRGEGRRWKEVLPAA